MTANIAKIKSTILLFSLTSVHSSNLSLNTPARCNILAVLSGKGPRPSGPPTCPLPSIAVPDLSTSGVLYYGAEPRREKTKHTDLAPTTV